MNPLFSPQLSMWVMKEALLPTFRTTGKVIGHVQVDNTITWHVNV